jgi:hypothetical protein
VLPAKGANMAETFRITGQVGPLPVTATWRDGYLTADAELLEAADDLIAGGYVFESGDGQFHVAASLDDPLAALLTMIRCFGRITRARIELPHHSSWDSMIDGGGNVVTLRDQGGAPWGAGDPDATDPP